MKSVCADLGVAVNDGFLFLELLYNLVKLVKLLHVFVSMSGIWTMYLENKSGNQPMDMSNKILEYLWYTACWIYRC